MNIDGSRRNPWRAACLCSLWLCACSSGASTKSETPKTEETPSDSKPSSPGMMMDGDEAPAPSIAVAANHPNSHSPVDATPSPDAKKVYYLAFNRSEAGEDSAGVFAVAADGGGRVEPQVLVKGAPLLAPVGITSSLDGKQLFIADSAAGAENAGALFSLSSDGGSLSMLSGTENFRPGGVTVAKRDGVEQVFFTGRDPASGEAGLFSTSVGGGLPKAVATGGLFAQPGGVIVAANGDAYVADSGDQSARVVRVHDGKMEVFVENIGVGFPAGVTLTHDDSTLIVSGLDPVTKHDVVYFVDVARKKLSKLTETVGAFSESAGLHRAHDVNVFAWADSQANDDGTVYLLE